MARRARRRHARPARHPYQRRLGRLLAQARPKQLARKSKPPLPITKIRSMIASLWIAPQGTPGGSQPLLAAASGGGTGGGRPPTPAMKRFADSIARQKRIKPPAGYATSGSICRAFLEQHAPRKSDGETAGKSGLRAPSLAQMLFAAKIAQEKGVVISEEARASSAAMSAWI